MGKKRTHINKQDRKQQIMTFMERWRKPYAPSLQEIGQGCEPPYSNAGPVSTLVSELVEGGYLARPHGQRSLHFVKPLEAERES